MIPRLRLGLAVIFIVIFVPLCALIVFPWTLITRKTGLLYKTGMTLTRIVIWMTWTRIDSHGLDALDPVGTYIFAANHASNLDPPILMPMIPGRASGLVKKELWRVPILGYAFDLASVVPVERSSQSAAIKSIRSATEVLRKGINMMVFPEGTRSPDGRLLPFKRGPFYLAKETGVPIVPVTMLGTYEMMPRNTLVPTGGRATVIFHRPLDPGRFSTVEELISATENAIRSALPRERQ